MIADMAQAESQVEGSQPGGRQEDDIVETKLNQNNDEDDTDNYTQYGSHVGESDAYNDNNDVDNDIDKDNYNLDNNNNANSNSNVVELKLDDSEIICYGSRIVLEHVNTEFRLHSHHVDYPVGSKQQQVTSNNLLQTGQLQTQTIDE